MNLADTLPLTKLLILAELLMPVIAACIGIVACGPATDGASGGRRAFSISNKMVK